MNDLPISLGVLLMIGLLYIYGPLKHRCMIRILPLFLFLFSLNFSSTAQQVEPQRAFSDEVQSLGARLDSIFDPSREAIVFTGSSSIRLWKTLEETFPEQQIINTGFGGSQSEDLVYFLDDLVLRFTPAQVFIYEGDNDLANGKKPREVLQTTVQIIDRIRDDFPEVPIVLIGAKPSISRWKLRGKYKRLNMSLAKLARSYKRLAFADVWTPMLLSGKKLDPTLFIEDGLHMNAKGYAIWSHVLSPLVLEP